MPLLFPTKRSASALITGFCSGNRQIIDCRQDSRAGLRKSVKVVLLVFKTSGLRGAGSYFL